MKSQVLALLLVSSILLTATGCRADPPEVPLTSSESTTSGQSGTRPTTTPAQTVSPSLPTLPTLPTEPPNSIFVPAEGMEPLSVLDIDGLDLLSDDYSTLSVAKDRMLITSYRYENCEVPVYGKIYLIDTAENKLLVSADCNLEFNYRILPDGRIFCDNLDVSPDPPVVHLLDSDLTIVRTLEGYDCMELSFAGVDNEGRFWFYDSSDPENCLLYHLDLDSDHPTEESIPVGCYNIVYVHSVGDGGLLLETFDEEMKSHFFRLDSDGSLSPEIEATKGQELESDLFYRGMISGWMLASADRPEHLSVLPKSERDEYPCSAAGEYLLTGSDHLTEDGESLQNTVYHLYCCSDSPRVYHLEMPAEWNLLPECISDGIVFFKGDSDGKTFIYRWSPEGEETTCRSSVIDLSDPDQTLERLADEIAQRSGVGINYTEGALEDVVYDYQLIPSDNPIDIAATLLDIDTLLQSYPEGFFDELCVDSYTAIELYFCDRLLPTDECGIDNAAAITNLRSDGTIILAFDMNYDHLIEQNFVHEIMHAMEARLGLYAVEIGLPLLEYWYMLNPDDFTYYYSYYDDNGTNLSYISDAEYTYTASSENAYFIDAYATSFPIEDRARILENLFAGNREYFESPGLRKKALYLTAVIRAAFPSVDKVQSAPWESLLGPSLFADFEPEVRDYYEDISGGYGD